MLKKGQDLSHHGWTGTHAVQGVQLRVNVFYIRTTPVCCVILQ